MKKILTFILLACLSMVAFAQIATTKPQALKSFMAKQQLSRKIEATQTTPATTKATNELETIEVYFESFYSDPFYIELDTIVSRNGETLITGGDWIISLVNERYQFNFDFYGGSPESPAGTYTIEDFDIEYSSCFHPEAPNNTSYYKKCNLTITEENLGDYYIKYILEADIISTLGVGGPENGAFKVYAEHTILRPKQKLDVAILDCVVKPEEDRFRIYGQNDTMDVDLTFFTETGVEGFYSHKLLDEENYKLNYKGKSYEIVQLEGIITSAETNTGGMAYVFLFEALTTDAILFNIAMEAPIIPIDTVEFTCNNMLIDDSYGMSDATIIITASNAYYEIMAGYNANRITAPAEYSGQSAYVYLTDKKADKELTSMQCTIKVTGNALSGYQVEVNMLGTDLKQYIMHLVYGVEEARSLDLNFINSAKSYYYIDNLGLEEVQLANYNGEYSVSFDILEINQILDGDGDFERANLYMEQTYIIHHTAEGDIAVDFAKVSGNIMQQDDTTFLTASVLGFDSCRYNITMFYAVPTPTKTVTYTFDGISNEESVEFTNATSSGIFVLDAMSEDGNLLAKVNVERIQNASVEGTFYNDGQFVHNDFYVPETYVKEWNPTTKQYDTYSVQKGTMTVTIENNILTAVASFICDNSVQYDLTFKTKYARERIVFDTEEGYMEYTFPADAEIILTDFVNGYGIIQLIIADEAYAADFYFNSDAMDPVIGIPVGVYPINSSFDSGTVLACKGVLPDGPAQSYFCGLDAEGYLNQLELYCLVDGTVTIENINGKLKVEVNAFNSYDVPVVLHYNAAATAIENINTDNTNVNKRIINGQLVIIRNGQIYDATGALVK